MSFIKTSIKTCLILNCLLILLFLQTASSTAQEVVLPNAWQQTNGPFGGTVWALAIDQKGDLFAGTYGGGIFISTDNGATWQNSSKGLSSLDVRALAINASDEIFAGTFGSGIFKSSDNGASWQEMNNGLAARNLNILSLIIDPRTQAIYAGTENGVFRSINGGNGWGSATAGLPENNPVEVLAINPQAGEIFAGLPLAGLFRSADEGGKWEQIDSGFGAMAILILPDNLILAGTTKGIFLSRDNGAIWLNIIEGLTTPIVQAFGTDPQGGIYACTEGGGIFRSFDLGASWTPVNVGLISNSIRTFVSNANREFFVGSTGDSPTASASLGVYRSTDGASSWELANTGLIATKVTALAGTGDGGLLAGTHTSGIFRSDDDGKSWQMMNNGLANGVINDILASPTRQGDLFAAVDGLGVGVFRTTTIDEGIWRQLNKGLENAPSVKVLAMNAKGDIWAGTDGAGVFFSLDNGDSWTAANISLEVGNVLALAINQNNHIFFGGPFIGIFRSTDDGATWQPINEGLTSINISALIVGSAGNLLAATSDNGIFRSVDNGDTWTASNTGLPTGGIRKLKSTQVGMVLALPDSAGVFLSVDEGQTWQPHNDSLTNLNIHSVAVNARGDVFAGTYGSGVFRNTLSNVMQEVFWVSSITGSWGNPANWNTQSVPGPSDRVFITQPGTYTVSFDIDASVAGLTLGDANATPGDTQTLRINGHTLTISDSSSVLRSGILDISTTANSALELQKKLENRGVIAWGGGTISGPDTLVNFGTMDISGNVDKNFRNGAILMNAGQIIWSENFAIQSGERAVIHNLSTGIFELQGGAILDGNFFPGQATIFTNVGKVVKSAGIGTSTLDVTFSNNGDVEIQAGILSFSSSYTQFSGTTALRGGDLASAGLLDIQGGVLEGLGSIAANVKNAGQLNPGNQIGQLEIKGDFEQTPAGTLNIDIGGVITGATFDRLNIGGQATFDGNLNIRLVNEFVPSLGNSFLILSFASRAGDFASINGLNINPLLRLATTYNTNDLTLVAQATALSITPDAIDFGEITLGGSASKPVTLTNIGAVDLTITEMTISGPNSQDFAIAGGGSATLQPGASIARSVRFSPLAEGNRSADLNVVTDLLSSPIIIPLAGSGIEPALFTQITTGAVVVETNSSTSCSWADYDNDGDADLFVTTSDAATINMLFQNNSEGAFTRVGAGDLTNDTGQSFAATWGDFDNDGDLDVFVANDFGENNFLYAYNSDGTFSRVTTGDIANDGGFSVSASWGDFDNDGLLDLFVANRQGSNFLYQNAGDGTFAKITSGAIVTDEANSMGCNWVDFDNDGDLDLFVANGGGQNNALYRNNGDGTFTSITAGAIVTDGGFSRGSSWGDYDNDGDLDVVITNDNNEPNFLYNNAGNGTFNRITNNAIATDFMSSTGSAWEDIDNDGDLDLVVANIDLEGVDNSIYLNNGAGNFARVSLFDNLGNSASSQGVSFADFDNDGDLDLFIANGGGQSDLFYTNGGNNNNWIHIQLTGATSNRSAVGAKVRIQSDVDGQIITQIREISAQTGGGFGGQSNQVASFGLGTATEIVSVIVEWPSGLKQELKNVAANQLLTITEMSTPGSEIIVQLPEQTTAGDSLNLTVIPPANFQAVSGQLFYRAAGQTAFQSIPLNINESGILATIPSADVTIRGLQYYIVLSDGQNTITLPPVDPQNNPQFIPAQIRRLVSPVQLEVELYKMVSVPLLLGKTDIDSVFFDDYGEYAAFPRIWRLFRWQNLQYAEYRRIDAEFTPGAAFWLITRDGQPFDVEIARSVDATAPFQITLQSGWNQIGNPFAFPVAWASFIPDGQAQPPVYWDGAEFIFNIAVLQPWEGYFVLNLELNPVTLSVLPIEAITETFTTTKTNNSPLEGGQGGVTDYRFNTNQFQIAEPMQASDYTLQLAATIPGANIRDTQNFLGFKTGAEVGWDHTDLYDAPAISEQLALTIIAGNERFASNFKPPSENGSSWQVELRSGLPEVEVKIDLHEYGNLSEGMSRFVLDLDRGAPIRINENSFFAKIDKNNPVRHLQFILGTDAFAEESSSGIPLIPLSFVLNQNYPNPFNPSTVISYQLPEISNVELTVFDQLGRQVVTLVQKRQATGSYRMMWDGRDSQGNRAASGIYLYRLKAGAMTQTRKMLLMH